MPPIISEIFGFACLCAGLGCACLTIIGLVGW